jgi:hypothetical protein
LAVLPEAKAAEEPRDNWERVVEDGFALRKTLEMAVGAIL